MFRKLSSVAIASTIFAGLSASPSLAASQHYKHHAKARHSRALSPAVSEATRNSVQAMIKASAPRYGVPTWFAMKIAKVESGYNPSVTGGAGEIGVFQLKCQTARGIGYRGSCSGLYNASTNVQYGLKYLSMAVKSSNGNLKLAASKHNGGLGRKSIVRRYVAMVF
jgi:soluble lytic murein transglycosylase-like protein